jgi:TraX protein.
MDTFKLKVFAITVMFIDHFGAIFVPQNKYHWLYFACRTIGRLAFPIFIFLIVEGFFHTRNIKKYLTRLGVFALISELPFDLAFYKYQFNANIIADCNSLTKDPSNFKLIFDRLLSHQNVFFTLFLGLLLITLLMMVDTRFQNGKWGYLIVNTLDALLALLFCAIAYILSTDYSIAGILMILSFYLFRGNKTMLALCTAFIMGSMFCNWNAFLQTGDLDSIISIFAVGAIIPIALYNGEKGKNVKYLFYIFYPAHLLVFFIIQLML